MHVPYSDTFAPIRTDLPDVRQVGVERIPPAIPDDPHARVGQGWQGYHKGQKQGEAKTHCRIKLINHREYLHPAG
jgi:hypothetical protein